jgi:hypothetical protein
MSGEERLAMGNGRWMRAPAGPVTYAGAAVGCSWPE